MALSKLSRSIDGLVAVVTGAGSGMGAATAKLFADQGARVAAIDINAEGLQQVVDDIQAADKAAQPWVLDLADAQATEAVIEEVAAHFGGIDLLINNAGVSVPAPIDHEDYGHAWERSIAVLLTAVSYTHLTLPTT